MFASIKQRAGIAALALALAIALFSACAANGDSVNSDELIDSAGGGDSNGGELLDGIEPETMAPTNSNGSDSSAGGELVDSGGNSDDSGGTPAPPVDLVDSGDSDDEELVINVENRISRIAFASDRDGDFEIYTMASSGSNVRQLTNNRFDDLHPAWSPNGARIAFVSDRDGGYAIYTMSS